MSKEQSRRDQIRGLQRQAEKLYTQLAELAGDGKERDTETRIDAIEAKLDKLIDAVSSDDDDDDDE